MWLEAGGESNVCPLRQSQSVVHIDAKVSNGVLDVGVPEQDLHGPQVSGRFVNERRLCSPHRMRAIFAAIQANRRDPFVNKPSVLPGTEVAHVVDAAGENEIEGRATTALKPCLEAPTCLSHDLELNRPAGLLLDHRRAVADLPPADDVTN